MSVTSGQISPTFSATRSYCLNYHDTLLLGHSTRSDRVFVMNPAPAGFISPARRSACFPLLALLPYKKANFPANTNATKKTAAGTSLYRPDSTLIAT